MRIVRDILTIVVSPGVVRLAPKLRERSGMRKFTIWKKKRRRPKTERVKERRAPLTVFKRYSSSLNLSKISMDWRKREKCCIENSEQVIGIVSIM
jgi:hypothetical protein